VSDGVIHSRGLFFGQRIPLPKSVIRLVSKYHAYLFAWATIYTLWYHPMENTFGHLLGFAHTGLLMLQGSLIYTPIHYNKYWIVSKSFDSHSFLDLRNDL
jgi:hypothetical protein